MPRFKAGVSGNPAGRPRGIPDKRTLLRGRIEEVADQVVQSVVSSALQGDIGACRLLLDKVIPNARTRDLPVRLESDVATSGAISSRILEGLSDGSISPEQAEGLTGALLNLARLQELQSLEARLSALESRATDR